MGKAGVSELATIVSECCDRISAEADEFDRKDVLDCITKTYPDVISTEAERLARGQLLRLIDQHLKRSGAIESLDADVQLDLPGFPAIPRNITFYDGDRVRYISALKAKAVHLRSAIRLREDQSRFNLQMADRFRAMLDFLLPHGDGVRFGEAIEKIRA